MLKDRIMLTTRIKTSDFWIRVSDTKFGYKLWTFQSDLGDVILYTGSKRVKWDFQEMLFWANTQCKKISLFRRLGRNMFTLLQGEKFCVVTGDKKVRRLRRNVARIRNYPSNLSTRATNSFCHSHQHLSETNSDRVCRVMRNVGKKTLIL